MALATLLQISDKSFWGDFPSWGLLLVGIVGAWIAIYTLFDIREQTGALINSERAWIMVDVDRVPGVGGLTDMQGIEMGVGPVRTEATGFRARIVCRNDGKTPAWITEKRAGLDILDSIPESPDWSRTAQIQVAPEPISVGQASEPHDETLFSKRGRAPGKIIILYGIVKYRDPFGANRSTSFGYLVQDDGSLERLPNSKYNENA